MFWPPKHHPQPASVPGFVCQEQLQVEFAICITNVVGNGLLQPVLGIAGFGAGGRLIGRIVPEFGLHLTLPLQISFARSLRRSNHGGLDHSFPQCSFFTFGRAFSLFRFNRSPERIVQIETYGGAPSHSRPKILTVFPRTRTLPPVMYSPTVLSAHLNNSGDA